jgi:hypothetical protein
MTTRERAAGERPVTTQVGTPRRGVRAASSGATDRPLDASARRPYLNSHKCLYQTHRTFPWEAIIGRRFFAGNQTGRMEFKTVELEHIMRLAKARARPL